MEETEEQEPGAAFTAELVSLGDCGPPVARYKDEKGNDVSPLPLHTLDDEDQEQLDTADSRKRFPPRRHPVMRTFLHVTTALYSMAGLGSLERSKAFRAIKRVSKYYSHDISHMIRCNMSARLLLQGVGGERRGLNGLARAPEGAGRGSKIRKIIRRINAELI